ncbi:MAG: Ig domain protein group 2 domain protein, partial [Candidatus Eremiobacteraeota bacterium]|nr:Ig domain protein group 2 domain protein [Candidatus Eremiobacteraeota bacterium]
MRTVMNTIGARGALRRLCAVIALCAAAHPSASAAALPASLAPPPPFPLVAASSVEREPVAPGVMRATYRLVTSAGPVVASVVTVDLKEPTVRLGAVLAHESIASKDEPASSMARRTGAVAGINGDYYDINATGAPVGVLVRGGVLDRSPSSRVALTVARDRSVRFGTYRFFGNAASGLASVPITSLNEWPPGSGAALLTPAFGASPPATPNVSLLDLQPLPADISGVRRYRVAVRTDGPPWPPAAGAAVRIAYGPAAQGFGPVP